MNYYNIQSHVYDVSSYILRSLYIFPFDSDDYMRLRVMIDVSRLRRIYCASWEDKVFTRHSNNFYDIISKFVRNILFFQVFKEKKINQNWKINDKLQNRKKKNPYTRISIYDFPPKSPSSRTYLYAHICIPQSHTCLSLSLSLSSSRMLFPPSVEKVKGICARSL